MVSLVLDIDHVQLAAPKGCEAAARTFFGALLERLERSHIECSWGAAIDGGRRFFASDPWGNRLEFTEPSATPPANPPD